MHSEGVLRARITGTGQAIESNLATDQGTVVAGLPIRGRVQASQSNPLRCQDAGPLDTALQLRLWIDKYRKTGRPVKVNFRRSVSWISNGDRATHYIHPYPGKLLPQIAHFFTHASTLSKPGDTIVDPFAGTGTVSLEAMLAGRNAVSFDTNPLATLIASVKTQRISRRRLSAGIRRLTIRLRSRRLAPLPSVVNIDHWFETKTIRTLREVLFAIESERSKHVRDFLLVCFSVLCRKVSRCDPRLSVPVRLKNRKQLGKKAKQAGKPTSTKMLYKEIIRQNFERMQNFRALTRPDVRARIVRGDARQLARDPQTTNPADLRLSPESAQLIISSPPYGGAQKYVRASSLSLGWLRLTPAAQLRALEDESIGREHFHKEKYAKFVATGISSADRVLRKIARRDPLRACISSTYLREMRIACEQMIAVLRPGGYLVLVIGNNLVARLPFFTNRYLTQILLECGLQLQTRLIDDIKSRGLMTKRNKTASVISREWVLLFRKPTDRIK